MGLKKDEIDEVMEEVEEDIWKMGGFFGGVEVVSVEVDDVSRKLRKEEMEGEGEILPGFLGSISLLTHDRIFSLSFLLYTR